jgi:hypothetical protein
MPVKAAFVYYRGHFNHFNVISVGQVLLGSTTEPGSTILHSPNQSIHLIQVFRRPILLIKVPAAVLANDH